MKTDAQIQQDVIDQLNWEPLINAASVGVSVRNGVVTLSGQVDTYMAKLAAEKTAQNIAGVKAVAENIKVGSSPLFRMTDAEIAENVLNTLKWHAAIPENKIKVKVEGGIVTLTGEVDWNFQREAARNAIVNFAGITHINNLVTIKPALNTADIREKITAAFRRSATIDADRVSVELSGTTAILKGKVHSFQEKEDAETAAWSAPGITHVENKIEITEPEFAI